MSIKHAVLGVIAEQPTHGYRVKELFDARMTPLWGVTTGQIYQTLTALERAGLVASRDERIGNRPARRIYTITDAGARELRRWLRDARPRLRSFRGELPIRMMLVRDGGADVLARLLTVREHEARHLLARIREMPRADNTGDRGLDVAGVFLAAMAHQLEAELATIARCRVALATASRGAAAEVEGGDAVSAATPRL